MFMANHLIGFGAVTRSAGVTYMAWNPSDSTADSVTNSNLTVTFSSSGFQATRGNKDISGVKGYWEISPTTIGAGGVMIGVAKATASLTNYVGADANGWGYASADGKVYNNAASLGTYSTYTTTDIISVAFDGPTGALWVAKNGAWQNSGDPGAGTGAVATGLTGAAFYAIIGEGSSGTVTNVGTANFGASAFTYTVPTGFSAVTV